MTISRIVTMGTPFAAAECSRASLPPPAEAAESVADLPDEALHGRNDRVLWVLEALLAPGLTVHARRRCGGSGCGLRKGLCFLGLYLGHLSSVGGCVQGVGVSGRSGHELSVR